MTSRSVTLTSKDNRKFGAYLAVPDKPKGGAVVVLQEIFGITANLRGVVDDLAKAGYIAIAPDLFWRQAAGLELDPGSAADTERAMGLLKGLDYGLAIEDALVAANYAKQLPGANGKLGAVGYCLGGRLAYHLAMKPGINAAVSYYGVGIHSALDQAANVKCKLLLHVAEADQLCPPEAQAAIAKAMVPYADKISIVSYPGVGHAFARRGFGPTFNAEAAKRADAATLALLETELS